MLGGIEGQLAVRRLDSLEYRLLPNDGHSLFDPFWSPDGRFLAYFNWDGKLVVSGKPHGLDLAPDAGGLRSCAKPSFGQEDVWIVDLDRGTHARLTFGATSESGPTWSPDRERVAYVRYDLGAYRILAKEVTGVASEFSPDGRWIAYVSNETGRREIYIRPWPPSGGKWQVSVNG